MVEVTFTRSMIKGALAGVGSEAVQFGPRAPMKVVLPNRALPATVKLRADVMAIPYPNAPVRLLSRTVPE